MGQQRLKGKVAVITGAASGIGAATARRFKNEGCALILGDIQSDLGHDLAHELGDRAFFEYCNVTLEEDVKKLVDRALSAFGQLDIMFNNAGIVGAKGPIDQTPADEWRITTDILINGVFYGVKHAAAVMKATALRLDHQHVQRRRRHGRARTSCLHHRKACRHWTNHQRQRRALPTQCQGQCHRPLLNGNADGGRCPSAGSPCDR